VDRKGSVSGMQVRRRDLLRAAGGASLLGTVLAGCGALGAKPGSANGVITLTFQPDGTLNSTSNLNELNKLYMEALQPFLAANKGINVQVIASLWSGNVQALTGGAGSDIISDDYAPPYWQDGLLLDLNPLIKRDGIDTSVWSAAVMAVFQQPFGTMMLPAYTSPFVYCVRLSDFDAAGLPYPDPDWTYTDFSNTVQQIAAVVAPRKGAILEWHKDGPQEATFMFKAFKSALTDPSGTKSWLNQPGSIEMGKWLYEKLIWLPGLVDTRGVQENSATDGFADATMQLSWDGGVLFQAQTYQDNFKWDYYPYPVFPAGRTTFATSDFYGINVQTKYPEESWSLLKFICYETSWQKSLMKIGMLQPSLNALWDAWISAVSSTAPFMANKQLKWFADAAQKGYAWPQQYYAYDDSQVQAVAAPYFTALYNKSEQSVTAAFTQAAQAIDTYIQSIAPQAEAQEKAMIAANSGSPSKPYPAPSMTGAGTPSIPAGSLITTAPGGVYTLTGTGWDIWGVADACTFAGLAATAYSGSWSCQVTKITNLNEQPTISSEAKVGLMARGDLSDDAPMVVLSVKLGTGIQTENRLTAGVNPTQTLATSSKTGLIAAQYLLHNYQNPASNYLLQSVWLKLERTGEQWTMLTSLDGKTWAQAGDPLRAEMAGAWVGIFATAGNDLTGGQGEIQAVFSNLSFTPTELVQLDAAAAASGSSSAS